MAARTGRPRGRVVARACTRTGMSRWDIPVLFAMRETVSGDIDLLWALRGLDEDLTTVRAAVSRYPGLRAAIEQQRSAARARLDDAKGRVAELQKKRRALEQEIAGVTESERRFQGQQAAVKKNEEYRALQHEIDGARQRRSDLETQVLVELEEEDRELAARPALERSLAAAETEAQERLAAIAAEERVHHDRRAALEAERQGHLAGLSPALRSRYERIHASRDGRALVAIVKGACGGCFRAQPPQVVQEARRRDRVLVCDGCGRLLLWPPESA